MFAIFCTNPVLSLCTIYHNYYFVFLDVDECAVKKPCKNGAKCENTRGGYKCTCVGNWFTGKHCDQGKRKMHTL